MRSLPARPRIVASSRLVRISRQRLECGVFPRFPTRWPPLALSLCPSLCLRVPGFRGGRLPGLSVFGPRISDLPPASLASPVPFIPPHHRSHVFSRSGKTNLRGEQRAVCSGCPAHPFQHVAAACIVIRQGIRQGIVRLRIAVKQLFQIKRPGHRVRARVQAVFMLETSNPFRIRPFLRGVLTQLHQTKLFCAAADIGMKTAFAPDYGLNQRRVDSIALGGRSNRHVLAAFQPTFPPPIHRHAAAYQG